MYIISIYYMIHNDTVTVYSPHYSARTCAVLSLWPTPAQQVLRVENIEYNSALVADLRDPLRGIEMISSQRFSIEISIS